MSLRRSVKSWQAASGAGDPMPTSRFTNRLVTWCRIWHAHGRSTAACKCLDSLAVSARDEAHAKPYRRGEMAAKAILRDKPCRPVSATRAPYRGLADDGQAYRHLHVAAGRR